MEETNCSQRKQDFTQNNYVLNLLYLICENNVVALLGVKFVINNYFYSPISIKPIKHDIPSVYYSSLAHKDKLNL